ncbi:MAG: hypothetical protein Kow0068_01490 [Marinilabiliales bacterium]
MDINYYYKVLGVSHTSTIKEIKSAFRNKAKLYHPDINPEINSTEEFIKINEAYRALMNYRTTGKNKHSVSYEQWIAQRKARARAEAAYYAKMRYENFKKSSLYKTTRIVSKFLWFIYILIGIIMFVSPIFYTITRGIDPNNPIRSVVAMILLSSTGIIYILFIVGTRKDFEF